MPDVLEPMSILLVEDDPGDALLVREALEATSQELVLHHVTSMSAAQSALPGGVACVLLDLNLPDARGLGALEEIQRSAPETPIVVLTGDIDERRAVDAVGGGAQDYLVKNDMDGRRLVRAIGYAVQRKQSERQARELAVLRVQNAANDRLTRGLVPEPLLQTSELMVHSLSRPGNQRQILGGDFFDVVEVAPGEVHAVLGDVCGHGPDEAALGVQLRIAWRVLTLAGCDQETILGRLDHLVASERHAPHVFATLATVRIDLSRRTVNGVLVGHPPPVLATHDRVEPVALVPGGPPLGLGYASPWHGFAERGLESEWTLLLYSDGIYEGRMRDGTRLELPGFIDLLNARETERPLGASTLESLVGEIESLNGGTLYDDVAMLTLGSRA